MKEVLFIIFLFLFSSCLINQQDGGHGSRHKSAPPPTPTKEPFYNGDNNLPDYVYMQDDKDQMTSNLILGKDFKDSFYLKGKPINQFLSDRLNRVDIQCLLSPFPSIEKILVLPAIPRSTFDNINKTIQYYFHVTSVDKTVNQARCQKSGLEKYISSEYSNYQLVYAVNELCSNCPLSVESEPLKLRNTSGKENRNIPLGNLTITIKSQLTPNRPASATCNSMSDCKTLKYDCCLEGQCVNDGQLRPGTDKNSSEYLQAINDISINQENKDNYPNLFFVCPTIIYKTPVPTPTASDYTQRLTTLAELYQCTTPIEGEMSLCTVTFEEASSYFMGTPTPFETDTDDRNFRDTPYMGSNVENLPANSVKYVYYGDTKLFERGNNLTNTNNYVTFGAHNDNLLDKQKVYLSPKAYDANLLNDNLKLTYQIDGSCRPINALLAKCYKVYVQGQDSGKITDHLASNSKFYIPYYADLNRNISVSVDGYPTTINLHWTLDKNARSIDFIKYDSKTGKGLDLYDGQTIKITYYSDSSSYKVLVKKQKALESIDSHCQCGGLDCTLSPRYGHSSTTTHEIVDYICVYPTPSDTQTVVNEDIYLSTKAIPLRLYNNEGRPFDKYDGTPVTQEGKTFYYKNDNFLDPINRTEYVGFNEIYGSIDPQNVNAPVLPKMVKVSKGKLYDIYINRGNFTPCYNCGSDYYSMQFKIFPETFQNPAGDGYVPNAYSHSRSRATGMGQNNYRSDDLLFGRACFLPATMIPWTHQKMATLKDQRDSRLRAQHFLFSNGYQRDWYGFNYGSVIGSFDGVMWFSIGNQRRISAKSNRLFLAMNAYFGDLSLPNDFFINISEASTALFSGSDVTSDFESDGASCQHYHICEKDSDCVTQLGWNYTCQSVNDINTNWPLIDDNGQEIPNAERNHRFIDLFIGGFKGGVKRCVYRSKGAPCTEDVRFISDSKKSYLKSKLAGLNACMPNSYCQSFMDDSSKKVAKFSRRIARYPDSPEAQNKDSDILTAQDGKEVDTFGLGARIIGRPYAYNGNEEIDDQTRIQLAYNNLNALCLSGKEVSDGSKKYYQLNEITPGVKYLGDRVLGIGMSSDTTTQTHGDYTLSNCSILDTDGKYIHLQEDYYNQTISYSKIKHLAGSQAFSTNLLKVFQNYDSSLSLLADYNSVLTTPILEEYRCLRAPGSPCYSDFDCGPSEFISEQVIDLEGQDYSNKFSFYEYKYWTEDLVCSQLNVPGSMDFDLKKNKCCRKPGEKITIGNANISPEEDFYSLTSPNGTPTPPAINPKAMAGLDISIEAKERYSRIAPAYYLMNEYGKETYIGLLPPIVGPLSNQCALPEGCNAIPEIRNSQFNTIHQIASKSCCTGHWVRNFNLADNGGGHTWLPEKFQSLSLDSFKCVAWEPLDNSYLSSSSSQAPPLVGGSVEQTAFSCKDPQQCHIARLTEEEARKYLDYFSSLELLGIPQVAISTIDLSFKSPEISCHASTRDTNYLKEPSDLSKNILYYQTPIPGTIRAFATPEYSYKDKKYLAANYLDNFQDIGAEDTKLKSIFSPDIYSCCLPITASELDPAIDVSDKTCCSGQKDNIGKEKNRCCLRSYTNISIYLNRYVSSEASHIIPSEVNTDPLTGTLKPGIVYKIAQDKQMCCSGNLSPGCLFGQNLIPDTNQKRRRFPYSKDDDTAAYLQNAPWNTNIYCVPKEFNARCY